MKSNICHKVKRCKILFSKFCKIYSNKKIILSSRYRKKLCTIKLLAIPKKKFSDFLYYFEWIILYCIHFLYVFPLHVISGDRWLTTHHQLLLERNCHRHDVVHGKNFVNLTKLKKNFTTPNLNVRTFPTWNTSYELILNLWSQ